MIKKNAKKETKTSKRIKSQNEKKRKKITVLIASTNVVKKSMISKLLNISLVHDKKMHPGAYASGYYTSWQRRRS